ncbi:MAG: family 78 glycoside hydrolase catalytic domain [Ruminococcus sp.]|uniref:alpha-L-rhamnosidase n=1 Tax=Schaedlerella arabinosiphila TaxID=2044587 RepID=A0A3R8KYR7_9FIRM|nr:alpha-L-rhamnosidase [Schaedlerella arabinosiphila]MCI8723872.1 family 78 glycoside hydrolase catalytic domain [Ruminococcus sp.]RRK32636.1 alfa-L-rhamnosidase RamA [Schaedlerella arabinosiphila]
MNIEYLKINHLVNPLGYDLANPTISYVVTEAAGKRQTSARVLVSLKEDFSEILYDSGERGDIVSTGFELPVTMKPMTRYYWKVWVKDETGDSAWSEAQWFETAKTVTWQGGVCRPGETDSCLSAQGSAGQESADCGQDVQAGTWQAKWITPKLEKQVQAAVWQEIQIPKPAVRARAYVTGLGLYEFYVNGEKQGEECLLPGFCDYDSWMQYQTWELQLETGKNRVELVLGDGWYKGIYGMRVKSENYGSRLAALAEIHVWYADGTKEVFGTDESWKSRKSRIVESGIYSGEVYDASLDVSETFGTELIDLGYDRLSPRLSPAIMIHERLKPVEVIHTPAGETVLDLGQNMVGWLAFHCKAPAGTRLHFQFGEILQDGNFYNENLRTAKAEFTYISDGMEREVRQHFTFYGFRFVKVEGWEGEPDPEDFRGLVIHSDMEELGEITTSDPLVNRLVLNAKWGMKGNFVDVPTDCPQRDERYGWTGDAQIFSGTASYFMDTCAFYTKYGRDLYGEQMKLDGSVPDVVPVANYPGDASTAWADAATIIPWNVYLHYGDKNILRRQYGSMKAWVDYMKREDDSDGAKRLWQTGTHYADWLALDGNYPGGVYGATDPDMIASAYYYYSANIVAKTAKILGKDGDAKSYETLAQEICDAFVKEYFTPSGKLAVDTTTAYVVALYMGLTPEFAYEKVCRGLLNRLKKNFYHLDTGFVGTPYLCRMLSENGMNDLAYHLLQEKGYPGWLYEVLMGATTIWERWNSVEPNGKISGTEMNSLNHYSYGSIVEWMFRNMAGINPCEEYPGFKKFRIAPMPNYRIGKSEVRLRAASGRIESAWEIDGKMLKFRFTVPFDTEAEIVLPDAEAEVIRQQAGGAACGKAGEDAIRQDGKHVVFLAGAGSYAFCYEPTTPYRKTYSLDSTWEELNENPKTLAILEQEYYFDRIPFEKELCTLEELTWAPFTGRGVTKEKREKLDRMLRGVE